jgi:hypothetical protein
LPKLRKLLPVLETKKKPEVFQLISSRRERRTSESEEISNIREISPDSSDGQDMLEFKGKIYWKYV